ncbi:MAG: hypothetical protein U1G07_20770 [Verrucomicrobiota bacterium]
MNWDQFKSILWLRWRLNRNQWARGGALVGAIMLLGAVAGLAIGVAGGVIGVLVGAFALPKATPIQLLLVWDGLVAAFVFFWLIGLLSEIQRSETIDLGRLLHLPVSLAQVFFLNYFVSLFTPSLALFVPAMLGLGVGLSFGLSWRLIFLIPLVLGLVFAITAWTYLLRGWLIALMTNQRRRRTIVMAVTVAIILLVQVPNLYFNILGKGHRHRAPTTGQKPFREMPEGFLAAHPFAPPLWPGYGAMTLAEGRLWPAMLATVGALTIGSFGLRRAYQSTLRFYRGDDRSKPRVALSGAPNRPIPAGQRSFVERKIPGLREDVAGLTLALLRSMSRAPEIKMALGSNIFGVAILVVMVLAQHRGRNLGLTGQMLLTTGMVAFPFLGMLQLIFNQFGHDREGFRALVLSPLARQDILLAKNLAFLPLVFTIGLSVLALASVLGRLPATLVLAAIAQLFTLFFLLSLAGNVVSVLAPYRVSAGSLKPTKAPAKKMLLIFLWQLVFPLAMLPVFVPVGLGLLGEHFGWFSGAWMDLLLSIIAAVLAAAVYFLALARVGRLLQTREQAILQVVTAEVE